MARGQFKMVLAADRRHRAGFQRKLVLLPFTGDCRNRRLSQYDARAVAHQASDQRPGQPAIALRIERTLISLVAAHRHAPIAGVRDPGLIACVGRLDVDLQAARNRGTGAGVLVQFHGCQRMALLNKHPPMGAIGVIHERAVANQLRIQAAVVGVINLLGHQAIESWAHLGDRLLRIDLERSRLLGHCCGGDKQQRG